MRWQTRLVSKGIVAMTLFTVCVSLNVMAEDPDGPAEDSSQVTKAPEDPPTDAQALEEVEQFQSEKESLDQAYQAKLDAIRKAYEHRVAAMQDELVTTLSKRQSEIASSDLDEAVRIRDLAEFIKRQSLRPPGSQGSDQVDADQADSDTLRLLRQENARLRGRIEDLEKKRFVVYGQVAGKWRKIHMLLADGTSVMFQGSELLSVGRWECDGVRFSYTWKMANKSGIDRGTISADKTTYDVGHQGRLLFGDPSFLDPANRRPR